DSKATALVTIGLFLEVATAAAQAAGIDEIIVIGPGDARPLADYFGEPMLEQVEVDFDTHVVVLPYSSGTTGFPKGVMLTHRNLVANALQTEPCIQPVEHEVALAFLPFFHIYGMSVLMNIGLSTGATVVTMPRFDLE